MSKRKYIPETPAWSRRWFLAGLRNLVWIVVVTTLVWVYADMEFTTEQDFRVTIRLTTGGAESLSLVPVGDGGQNIDVNFKLQGNRGQLDAFARWLNDRSGTMMFDVSHYSPSKTPTTETVSTVLDRLVNLSKRGLTYLWSDPATISFRLDRRIRVPNVPVKFEYTGVTLASEPVVKPAKVAIYVGETAWSQIEAALPEASRKLKTRQVDLKNAPTDKPITAEIIPSITIKPDEPPIPVEPEVDTVKVEVQVQHALGTKTFNVTPRILTPPTWSDDSTWSEYKLTRKPNESWTKEITVQGAKTDVESLKPEDVEAYVVLREDDKKPVESWLTREVVIRFPPKLKVELAPTEKPVVSFKLEKRTPAVPP